MTCKTISIFLATLLLPFMGMARDATPEIREVVDKENYKPHIGFTAGVGNPEGALSEGGIYALQVGYQPIIPLSLAGEYSIANYQDKTDLKLVRHSFLLRTAYNFGGSAPFIRYTYVGLGIGPMWEDTATEDELALGIVPNIGFDYPLKNIMESPLSLGVNVGYLYTTTTNPDVLNVNGVIKYWY